MENLQELGFTLYCSCYYKISDDGKYIFINEINGKQYISRTDGKDEYFTKELLNNESKRNETKN